MISIIEKLNNEGAKLFSGYVIFAGVATVVDLGFLYLFTEFVGWSYFVSAIVAYMFGMLTNYSLNKVFNFKNKSKEITKQFGLFIVVALVGLVFNQAILWVLVEFADMWYMSAKLVSVAIVMLWSFYGHKKLTFGLLK